MLSLTDQSARGANQTRGLSRRAFLRIGTLGLGGLTLPHLFRAEAAIPEPLFPPALTRAVPMPDLPLWDEGFGVEVMVCSVWGSVKLV